MDNNRRTRRAGIEERTDARGRTQYRGHVWDRRARKKIRGEWTYSLAAAKAWRHDALARLDAGLLSADRGDLIEHSAPRFIDAARRGEARTRSGDPYKPSAIRNYEQGFRLRIVPTLGASRLADVRTADLQRLVGRWQADGLNPSTIRNTMNALRALYRQAVAHGECHHNPTHGVMLPAVRGKRDRIEPPARSPSAWWPPCPSRSVRCGPPPLRPGCATASYAHSSGSTLTSRRAPSVCTVGGTPRKGASTRRAAPAGAPCP